MGVKQKLPLRRRGGAFDVVDEQLGGGAPQLLHRVVNRGQPGVEQAGKGNVVEAGDRAVVGHRRPRSLSRRITP